MMVDVTNLNLEHQMDIEMSRKSFAYFFEHILNWQMTNHQREWLELMETTNRTVVICSRGHGKSVCTHGLFGIYASNLPLMK